MAKSNDKIKKMAEKVNAWGQDEKTARGVRKQLRHEKKMKAFNKHADERFKAGF